MQDQSQADERLMALVEQALTKPDDQREVYLRHACEGDSELFSQAWEYVQWEKRMDGFLLDPVTLLAEPDLMFAPGQLLASRFRIVREVAQGGMGIVWEAMDEKLERKVAIKCAKAGFGKQLPPEVRNAREISHPNVCKIFEIHTDREIDFIVMEFLEGETLAERLREVTLPKKKARAIAQQLCAGLAEAHRNQVIHGDLKSNNVILAANPDGSVRAVITDFGLARKPDANDGILAGTPEYMAPELWKGAKASVASDIYALGVILCELVSGRKPGELGNASPTLTLGEHPSQKPAVGNRKWNHVLARCLDPDPARRFRSASEVARALGPPRTRRWFLIAAAAAVLAIATGAVTYQRATAPEETVRLAMLPFLSSPGTSSIADSLLRDTTSQLARLESSARTKLIFIHNPAGATDVLRGALERQQETIVVHAYLTDARSGADAKEWKAVYKPEEMRYAPVALAGVVTGALHLPPLAGAATVNAAARKDYLAGLSALRRDSGIDSAVALFEKAVKADPDSPLTHAALAEAQWSKYRISLDKVWLDHAAESVEQARARNPDLAQVHRATGLLQAEAGRYEQASAEYLRTIELNPHDGDAYRHLGQVYQRNSQLDEALAAFHKAIEADPQQYRNYRELATFYYYRATYEQAIKYLQKAVELAPDEPLMHYGLGTAYLALGQFTSAEKEFRFSIQLRETPTAVNALGAALMYQGRDQDAIPQFARALHLGPETYRWWINLGTAYRRVGASSDSRRSYLRGLDLVETEMVKNPRSGVVRASLAYVCTQLGDQRRAESEVGQALQQAPNDADMLWWAALTYEALARRNDTLSVLAAAPPGVVANLSRWPDVADLHKDSRFLKLLASHVEK